MGESGVPVTWKTFLVAFWEKYFSVIILEHEIEFLELTQWNMSVAEYAAKFAELSCFAPHMVENEARKAYEFERSKKVIS